MKTTADISIEKAAPILKLLGDKTRLTMVALLHEGECCVCEFTEIFNMSQPSISQHLRKLRDAGVVHEERRGQWVFYSLNTSNELYPLVEQVVKQLPSQKSKLDDLEKNGSRVVWCEPKRK
ncbi:transcriptional regulator, ArsR family [Alteribacillus persepolensis]|uniref:Transcriptional regulator, ArsR family n=1 Tax=Alteribacillus persepolensis TaxID=568899 RepID=A0A1G8GNJ6_9BACI|nr:metalloregulator ArsR/SmtB family transcription factor [Alteribacillus persepolensis]SDH95964.1 transcriptional regulator, ArsR family [Alteribacillus persepolensis]